MKNPAEDGVITCEGYGGFILDGNEASVISQSFDSTSIQTHGG